MWFSFWRFVQAKVDNQLKIEFTSSFELSFLTVKVDAQLKIELLSGSLKLGSLTSLSTSKEQQFTLQSSSFGLVIIPTLSAFFIYSNIFKTNLNGGGEFSQTPSLSPMEALRFVLQAMISMFSFVHDFYLHDFYLRTVRSTCTSNDTKHIAKVVESKIFLCFDSLLQMMLF